MRRNHRGRSASGRATLLVLLLAGAGCPSRTTSALEPDAVLKRYAAAVAAGQFDDAYALMSESFRQRYNQKAFERMLRDSSDGSAQLLEQLQGKPREVKVAAKVDYGDGDSLQLIVEDGRWRIASNPVDFYGQRTPEEALRSFVRAIERRRYDVVLRFVPARWANVMTKEKIRQRWEGDKRGEVDQLLKNLRANLDAPIRRDGNTATMPYGDNHEVRFVREDGVWKIEDPD